MSYHEIGHALVAALQKHSAPVHKITIIPRTSGALGYTMQVEEGEQNLMSREEILDLVWGRDYFGELKIVDVNVRRLRLKIEDSPTSPTYINTVWGYGYKWGF